MSTAMTRNDVLRDILRKVLAKSDAGNAKWHAVGNLPPFDGSTGHGAERGFQLGFSQPPALLRIASGKPRGAPNWASAGLMVNGAYAATLFAEDGSIAPGVQEDYELVERVYKSAAESVDAVDETLNQINDALDRREKIGS